MPGYGWFYGGCTEPLFHSQMTTFPSSIHRGKRLQATFPVLKLSAAYLQPTYYFLPLFLELINLPNLSVLFCQGQRQGQPVPGRSLVKVT